MVKRSGIIIWLALLLFCCAAALASEDPLVDEYFSAFSLGPVIQTIMWSLAYLPIFAGGLIIPMHYMQRFTGFEAGLLFWLVVLWLGGLGANYIGYAIAGDERRWLALLITVPIMFGWCLLICSRTWADLTVKEALLVAGIITVLCAPYFGPTWRVQRVEAPEQAINLPERGRPARVSYIMPERERLARTSYSEYVSLAGRMPALRQ